VGQAPAAVAGSDGACVTASVTAGVLADPEDVLADGVVLSELHAASAMAADAAQATSAMEGYTRDEFTLVTLHPRQAILAGSPADLANRPVSVRTGSIVRSSSGTCAHSDHRSRLLNQR
jgi:hypothetical protein